MVTPQKLLFSVAVVAALFLSACETTTTSTARALPRYEPSLPRSEFQTVRTTAYTHTESDHREYSNRNALGGQLQAAGRPIHRAENTPRAIGLSENEDDGEIRRVSNSGTALQPFSTDETTTVARVTKTTTQVTKTTRGAKRFVAVAKKPPPIGSAAADWGRWPAGTTFRVLSTGQIYRIEDYGWALSGRNTIDLYMATRHQMNSWGVREEPIQILQWGDRQESLRFLAPRQKHQHVKRMMLELEGRDQEAAALQ